MSTQDLDTTEQTALPAPTQAPHTGAVAAAETTKAQITALHQVALLRERDVDLFRTRILKDCKRPRFADAAMYEIPRGNQTVTGMSIRFAESALRHFGNLMCEATVVDDNDDAITYRVSCTDLQSIARDSKDVTVRKTVERKNKPKNEKMIRGTRFNSFGDLLYIVAATDDEILMKVNNQIARAKRNLILAFLPFDIVEEAQDQIHDTNRAADAADPDRARNRLLDAFTKYGVTPADVREYLGKPLERMTPTDMDELKKIGTAMREGSTTWEEVMEEKKPEQTAGNVKGNAAKKPKEKKELDHGALVQAIETALHHPDMSEQMVTSAASEIVGEVVIDWTTLAEDDLRKVAKKLGI